MDEDSGNVQRASTYSDLPKRERQREKIGKVRELLSNGVMDEGSGKIQEASAHVGSFIMVNGAVVEGHITAIDAEASALPRKGHVRERSSNGVMEEGSGKA